MTELSPSTNQDTQMPFEHDEESLDSSATSPAPPPPLSTLQSLAELPSSNISPTIKSSSSSSSNESHPEVVLALNSSMRRSHYLPSDALALPHDSRAITKRVRPPLRFDKHFLADPDNRQKLIQLATGAFALLMTKNCYPNEFAPHCTGQLFSFFQLFNIVCVHVFFIFATAMLALCSLFGFHDTFYEYNFPLLEKLFTALAIVLYSIGSIIVFFNMFSSRFSVIWPFQVLATFVAGATYAYDFWKRVNSNDDGSSKALSEK